MYKKIYLLSSENSKHTKEEIDTFLEENYELKSIRKNYQEKLDYQEENTLFLLDLNDEQIKEFFNSYIQYNINVAILPNDEATYCMSNYGISKDLKEALSDALNKELLTKIDLLKCNDYIALNKIEIGDMHGINLCHLRSNFQKLTAFYKNLVNINFKSYTFTTSKEHSFKSVATGIIVLEHSINSSNSAIKDKLSFQDGKLNALILSPSSVLSYFWYLISIYFYEKISILSLPKSLGFIKSESLIIETEENMDYKVDDILVKDVKSINIVVLKEAFNLHIGSSIQSNISEEIHNEEKDNIKIASLPNDELSEVLLKKKLPFFKKASDDDFKELFLNLNASAKFTFIFSTLMILSTLLATTGLFANSAPVIIGAMILAPLMSPITSLSMGVIRANNTLLIQSAKTLFYGVLLALFVSSVFTCIIPLDSLTNEMKGRLNPNLLDLFVAIFSGIAAAYANSKEEIAKSLAGVAIAVALVPPLSVTGIGIGLFDISIIYGSFLLFITNLVGITLSAALTFIVLGYSPIKKAKKGLLYTSLLLAFIAVPLIDTFDKMVENNRVSNKIKQLKHIDINNKAIDLKLIEIKRIDDIFYIDLQLMSSSLLDKNDYKFIKENIEKKINEKIVLQISSKLIVK